LQALDPTAMIAPTDYWRHSKEAPWFELAFADGPTLATPTPFKSAAKANYAVFQRYTYQLLHLDLGLLRQLNRVQRALALAPSGDNLANVVATLTRKHQAALAEELCRVVPVFNDLDVQPIDTGGHHNLRFQDRWDHSVWYQPQEVSDGTMLLTAYLTIRYQEPPVGLLAIEEPERGLHPYLIGQLVDTLRKLSRGDLGGAPIQVVLATHSAELLDHVEASEVRFLSRDTADGSVTVSQIDGDSEDWQAAYREYSESLGSAWLAGGLGGVPGSPTS
jgi:predicted ATPase